MNLLTLFLLSQSIYNIIGIIFFAVLVVISISVYSDLVRLNKKLEDLANEGMEIGEETKDMVEKVGQSLTNYILFRILHRVNKGRNK